MEQHQNRCKNGLLEGQTPERKNDPRALALDTRLAEPFFIYPEELKLIWAFLRYTRVDWNSHNKHFYMEFGRDGRVVTRRPRHMSGKWEDVPLEFIIHQAIWGKPSVEGDEVPFLYLLAGLHHGGLRYRGAQDPWVTDAEVVAALGVQEVDRPSGGAWAEEVLDAYEAWYDAGGRMPWEWETRSSIELRRS